MSQDLTVNASEHLNQTMNLMFKSLDQCRVAILLYGLYKAVLIILIIACITRGLYLLDFAFLETSGVGLAFAVKIKTDLGLLLAINTFFFIIRIKNTQDHNYYKLKYVKRAWRYNFGLIGIAFLVYFLATFYDDYSTLIIYTYDISLVVYLISIFRFKNKIVGVMKNNQILYDKNEKKELQKANRIFMIIALVYIYKIFLANLARTVKNQQHYNKYLLIQILAFGFLSILGSRVSPIISALPISSVRFILLFGVKLKEVIRRSQDNQKQEEQRPVLRASRTYQQMLIESNESIQVLGGIESHFKNDDKNLLTEDVRADIRNIKKQLYDLIANLEKYAIEEMKIQQKNEKDKKSQKSQIKSGEEDGSEDEENQPLIKQEQSSILSQISGRNLFEEFARATRLYYYEKDLERLKSLINYCKHEIIVEYQKMLRGSVDEMNTAQRKFGEGLKRKLENLDNKLSNSARMTNVDKSLNFTRLSVDIKAKLEEEVIPNITKLKGIIEEFDNINFYRVQPFPKTLKDQGRKDQKQLDEEEFEKTLNSYVQLADLQERFNNQKAQMLEIEKFHDELLEKLTQVQKDQQANAPRMSQ
ncbi:UNKNOWN [Stylonychia lemnae]|uniref:Transmembrane protein n=1 Tax=Stylonychia lemnae TaxID=5949 RepID=A0A078AA67_STYLE|nr:UNKNOWN [Stylonychia lemnae]|eukprot:CDW78776.1 UNKNOWN [Stylonychia lemnae]